jgi:hypothetical protein
MKALAIAAVLAVASGASASGPTQTGEHPLMVCLDPNGKAAVIDPGRAAATRLLKRAGIRLEWRNSERPCLAGGGIVVTVLFATPNHEHPGALAYALPYEHTHIFLLYDRILEAIRRPGVPSLMGYVLAHELGHMLQGVARHSTAGIMKAHWNYLDYTDIQLGHLDFTAADVALIRDGLKRFSRPIPAE